MDAVLQIRSTHDGLLVTADMRRPLWQTLLTPASTTVAVYLFGRSHLGPYLLLACMVLAAALSAVSSFRSPTVTLRITTPTA